MNDPISILADAKTAKLQKEIEKVYKEAQKDIEKKMSEFSRKYAIKDNIYREKMKNGEITKEQYRSWVKGQVFQNDQWKAKRDQIVNTIMNSDKIAMGMINGEMYDMFATSSNYQAYSLEHGAGVNFGFDIYDKSTVTRLVKDDPEILPKWKVNEPKNYVWNRKKVVSSITQGIIQGEKLDDVTKRIATNLASNNKNLMRTFARTAMTGAQNAGRNTRLQEAKGKGINVRKKWMATLDGRTRDSHAAIDGESVPMGDKWHPSKFSNGCEYPGDPKGPAREVYNCRCTMIGDLVDYPSEFARYDNIRGIPIKNMTYSEWKNAKSTEPYTFPMIANIGSFQSKIGSLNTVAEVNDLMNSQGWFRSNTVGSNLVWNTTTKKYDRVGGTVVVSKADLTGCDLESAKSIAASYERVFAKYPQLISKLDAPDAQPRNMSKNTYAWCYTRQNGKVQVNPSMYSDWSKVQKHYDHDVVTGWHPKGTTAESIVVHELGHAIDGLLAREGILGGITASGEYRYASSSMKMTILNRIAKRDPQFAADLKMYDGVSFVVLNEVSEYATKNNREWFAECFAEYITSANPRQVAKEFGAELEKLLKKLK